MGKPRKGAQKSSAQASGVPEPTASRSIGLGFYFRIALLVALWIWFLFVVKQYLAARAKNILYEGFDPYKILGVDAKSSGADVNRAFRREALKYHPDKNSAVEAVEKFLLVRKAYDSLTDEEGKQNFKTFGNPDGPQYVQLFAIPSFIKDKEASRGDGKLRYKNFMFRAADLQLQALGITFSVLGISSA